MADLSTGGGGGGDAYTYVQDAQPSGAAEGESWYDTGANAAYVYDGASWIEQTVAAHSDLSGVSSSDHHAKPTGTGNTGQTGVYEYNYNDSISFSTGSGGTTTVTSNPHNIYSDGVEVNGSASADEQYIQLTKVEVYSGGSWSTVWTGSVDIAHLPTRIGHGEMKTEQYRMTWDESGSGRDCNATTTPRGRRTATHSHGV